MSSVALPAKWRRHGASRLKVENLVNTFSSENVVAALDPLRETAPAEQRAEVVESDAGIRRAPQYSQQDRLTHTSLSTRGQIPALQMPGPVKDGKGWKVMTILS